MIALALPDEPRWVLAHGIAADPDSWCEPGIAVGNPRAKLVVALPDAPHDRVLARAPADHAIVNAAHGARIDLFTLGDPAAVPDLEGAVLLADPSLAPPGYTPPIHAAYVDDEPVAFAYAPWRSAAYFDAAVDVLPRARQLGLGTIVAAALIRAEHPRAPVWGAAEDDLASRRLR